MNPLAFLKLQAFLARLTLNSAQSETSDSSICRSSESTPEGTPFDIYRHRRKQQSVCIALHGLSLNGGRDPRLVHFARTLAHFGITCVAPDLNALSACRWDIADIEELAEIIALFAERSDKPPGIIGFSFGGSYALIAAGRPELAERIQWLVSFGAYHRLQDVFDAYLRSQETEAQTESEWDIAIYWRLALAYGYPAAISFPQELQKKLEDLLQRYCHAASAEEKREFYESHLRAVDFSEAIERALNAEILQALSPAGKLEGLTCPVALIHDRHDYIVPPAQAEALFSELPARKGSRRHRLVLTSLLSHVSLPKLLNVKELLQLADALSPLLA